MNKFKVGDVVVATKGADIRYAVTRNGWKGVVSEIRDTSFDASGYEALDYALFELASEVVEEVVQPVKFILQYELCFSNISFETLATMKEVEERILELSKDSDLKHESIRVYEIASVFEATIHTRILFGSKVSLKETKPEDKVVATKPRRTYKTKKRLSAEREAARKEYRREYMKKWWAENKGKKK